MYDRFRYNGVGPVHHVMGKDAYVQILKEVLLPYATGNIPLK